MTEEYFDAVVAGCAVKCKMYRNNARRTDRLIICCHGFGGHKDNSASRKLADRALAEYADAAAVTFDWPCHGADAKNKLLLDDGSVYLETVRRYLSEKNPGVKQYVYAISFGAHLTLKYIYENGNPFERIALRCPAVNMYDVLTKTIVAPEDLEKLLGGRDIDAGFDRKVRISRRFTDELRAFDAESRDFTGFADDILIIHGTDDEVVPFGAVRGFAERNAIRFIAVEDADHRFLDTGKMNRVISETLSFFFGNDNNAGAAGLCSSDADNSPRMDNEYPCGDCFFRQRKILKKGIDLELTPGIIMQHKEMICMNETGSRILAAYFSRAGQNYTSGGIIELKIGNTAVAAGLISDLTGAELFEIRAVNAYPDDYTECTAVAGKELKANSRPELVRDIEIADYDTVILGYPSWWGTMPMAVKTFLDSHDFSGKKVLPLCTHEGSGMGHSEADLRELIPGADIRSGLAIRGSSVKNAADAIRNWLTSENVPMKRKS